MPSWGEIQEYARSKYQLQDDETGHFTLVFGWDGGRSQLVFVRRFEAFEREWIEFRSAICSKKQMSAKVALRKNRELVVGSICLEDNDYVLVHNAPLDSMDPEEFELPLHVIARTADNLEETYSGDDEY